MSKTKTWTALIPLIGGFPLGAERRIGTPPKQIIGYGFKNDEQYLNWANVTNSYGIEYTKLDESGEVVSGPPIEYADIVVATPPCSALCGLNTAGKESASVGAMAASTRWMDYSLREALGKIKCQVFIMENAPALATNKGAGVAARLIAAAKEYGYSSSFYKTSTNHHGVPQARHRTFYFAWKNPTAPILPWYNRDHLHFTDYLKEISPTDLQQDLIVNQTIINEPCKRFINESLGIADWRQAIIEANVRTAFQYIHMHELMPTALKWFEEVSDEKGVKFMTHAIKKFGMNKGIWDGSIHVFDGHMNALVGRNVCDTIHPFEDRGLSIREAMHIMAMPKNFELLGGVKNFNMICQNVPVCTAADMIDAAIKFIDGELVDSSHGDFWQNNESQKFVKASPKIEAHDIFEIA